MPLIFMQKLYNKPMLFSQQAGLGQFLAGTLCQNTHNSPNIQSVKIHNSNDRCSPKDAHHVRLSS